jgi:uncharacterized protein (TIGR03435 family)
MTECVVRRLGFQRRLIFLAAGLMVFAIQAAAGQVGAAAAQDAVVKSPAYDVVSIKPSHPDSYSSWWKTTADGISVDMTLKYMIFNAYSILMDNQVSGMPAWASSAQFAVEAKMDADTAAALGKLSDKDRKKQRQLMLQAVLADRFKLRVHHETRELPVYALVVAKGGLKINESPANEGNGESVGRGQLTGQAMQIGSLAMSLSGIVGRLVVDKTGLTGKYGAKLQWTPDDQRGTTEANGATPPEDSAPSIFTALQEQLGLKLESSKEPVDTIVIDHVQLPSKN